MAKTPKVPTPSVCAARTVTTRLDRLESAWSAVTRLSRRPAPTGASDTGRAPRPDDARGSARYHRSGRHVLGHHRVGAHGGALADRDAAEDRCVRADGDAVGQRRVGLVGVLLLLVEG